MFHNRKTKTAFRIAALALSLMLILSACAKPASKSADGSAGTGKFPEKPITMMVPFAPGGSSDLLARAVEKVWTKYCPQPILLVNKTGGGGLEGATFVSRSKPDGYTIEIGYGSGHDFVMPHLEKIEYDPFRDLIPVARLSIHSVLVLVPGNSPFKSIKDVVDYAKKENKPITAAVSTTAGAVDIVMRGIGKVSGINITPVPHAGGSQAMTTLIGGQTLIGGNHPAEVVPMLKDNRVRPIGIALPERDPNMKDVPTLKEQGIDFYTWGSVKGIAVPPKTPKPIIDYYADLFKKICDDPDFKKSMADMLQPINYQGPDDFAKFAKQAYDDYGKLVKDLGLANKK